MQVKVLVRASEVSQYLPTNNPYQLFLVNFIDPALTIVTKQQLTA